MTEAELLSWLKRRHQQRTGIPFPEVPPEHLDSLMGLEESGDIYFTLDPPLIWINPERVAGKDTRKGKTRVWLESDLPSSVETLDKLASPECGPKPGKLNGKAIYRPDPDRFLSILEEPSQLFAMGPTPWPPPGCEVEPRKYREHEHQYTITLIHDMVITSPACPICGHREKHANCLVCDAWPRRETPIRLEKWDPEEEARVAKAEARKAAKEAERKMKERIKALNTKARKSA